MSTSNGNGGTSGPDEDEKKRIADRIADGLKALGDSETEEEMRKRGEGGQDS